MHTAFTESLPSLRPSVTSMWMLVLQREKQGPSHRRLVETGRGSEDDRGMVSGFPGG